MIPRLLRYLFGGLSEAQSRLLHGDLSQLSTADLKFLCAEYWRGFPDIFGKVPEPNPLLIGASRYDAVTDELQTRATADVIPWACECLIHANYRARVAAAEWLRVHAEKGQLGELQPMAEAALLVGIDHFPTYEDKEAQANRAALSTLVTIGSKSAYQAIHFFLTEHEWRKDSIRGDATRHLEQLTGESFTNSPEPEAAALTWLTNHPDCYR